MTYLHLEYDFLTRPFIHKNESVRSLLSCLTERNKLPMQMLGVAGRIANSTQLALTLSQRAGWDPEVLKKRAAWDSSTSNANGWVTIGLASMGKRNIVGENRRICPRCLKEKPWTPIDWELRINEACHVHGLMLVDRCSRCKKHLIWYAHSYECRQCGLPWREIQSSEAPQWSQTLSRWLHASVSRSLEEIQEDGKSTASTINVRLDKLLLMIEVLRHEIFRNWLTSDVWEEFNLPWAIHLLTFDQYRSWLWDKIFLHLSKEPLTLAKNLVPTGSVITVSTSFDEFVQRAPIPQFIITSLMKIRKKSLVRRLSLLPRFDTRLHGVGGARQMSADFPHRNLDANQLNLFTQPPF